MAEIAPLTPLRYDIAKLPGGLASVVAPPYDVIGPEERAALAARDPRNVVRLELPEGEGDSKYTNAAALLAEWRSNGTLIRDEEPAFYRLDQTFAPPGGGASITRRGFLALVKLAPFSARIVLPHERTLSGPKEDRLKLFRATRASVSPGFMLYRDPKGELDAPLASAAVLADMNTPDGVRHVLAKVTAKDALRAIIEGVARSTLLIADGHHRYETAVRYGEEVSSASPDAGPRAEHKYFMTFLVNGDDPKLVVFPTHRHVHSLASFSFDAMLRATESLFTSRALPNGADAAAIHDALSDGAKRGPSFAAASADGRVVVLSLRADADLAGHPALRDKPEVLRRTDVVLLHAGVLEHALGITPEAQAAKTNIYYPQDTRGALADVRAGKGQVLFVMNATPVADVRRVAEAGEVMPQKSTFFFPKVLTGLAIHTLEPSRSIPTAG